MPRSEIEKLLHTAPLVTCPGCQVEMTLRHIDASGDTGFSTALYRCPKCGTETQRQFKADT
jgi:predicted RNA-binding Zn-ribbon protein involved in translation (DUF1610 family)